MVRGSIAVYAPGRCIREERQERERSERRGEGGIERRELWREG